MAMRFFFAGAKVAIGAVVGEFVGSDRGLSYVILSATSYWKTELAFSSMILLSLMAIVLFGVASLVERFVCPWLPPDLPPDERGGHTSHRQSWRCAFDSWARAIR